MAHWIVLLLASSLSAQVAPVPKYRVVKAGKADQTTVAVNALADAGYRLIVPGKLLIMRVDAMPPDTYRYVSLGGEELKSNHSHLMNRLNELGSQGYRWSPAAELMEKDPRPKNYRYASPHVSGWSRQKISAMLSLMASQGYWPVDVKELVFLQEVGAQPNPIPISGEPEIEMADAMRADNVMKQVGSLANKGFRYLGPGLPLKGGGLDVLMQKCAQECKGPFEYGYFDVHDMDQLLGQLNEEGKDSFRVVAQALTSRPHLLERSVGQREIYSYHVLQAKEPAVLEQLLNAPEQEGYVPIGYVSRVGVWTADEFLILEKAGGVSAAPR
jgi:hypothetical protein